MSLVKTERRLPFIFDEFLTTDWFGGTANGLKQEKTLPAVNIRESEHDFLLELAAPGLGKEDFNIEIDNDILTISSELKEDSEQDNEPKHKYTRKEFGYTSFKRTFSLPDSVQSNAINAAYQHGILSVTLPKKEEAKVQPKRLISVA